MDSDAIKKYCLSKKGAFEDYPFDDETLAFKVGSKMFALTNINDPVLKISLKCDPYIAIDLRRDYPCITPGYHLNKSHWNTVKIDGTISDDKICWLIDMSYELVFKGLKKEEKMKLK
jgi:predicted DNA-binding protein (MmcQ/YjbR family)